VSVAFEERTVAEVFLDAARLAGLVKRHGTSTAASAFSILDATNEKTPVADDGIIVGTYIYMLDGAAVGSEREVDVYDTLGQYEWADALGTAPTAATRWVRLTRQPQDVIDAIAKATREATYYQALSDPVESISADNLLGPDGDFEVWTVSTTPDGWEAPSNATVAQSKSGNFPPRHGDSCAVVTDGGSGGGYFEYIISRRLYGFLASKTLYMKGKIAQATSGRGRIQLRATDKDGAVTTTEWDCTTSAFRWQSVEEINSSGLQIPAALQDLRLRVSAEASSGVAAVDDLVLYGADIREYKVPIRIIGADLIIRAETEYGNAHFERRLIHGEHWEWTRDFDGRAQLRLLTSDLLSGSHLQIYGYRAADVQTSITQNVEPNPEWLTYATARKLAVDGLDSVEGRERMREIANWLENPLNLPAIRPVKSSSVAWVESR
jgi:hypothetical protein